MADIKLSSKQKQAIATRIKSMDPKGQIVTLEPNDKLSGGVVSYNTKSGIVLHEKISKLTDEE